MKPTTLLLITLHLLLTACQPTPKTIPDQQHLHLKGNIKEVAQRRYHAIEQTAWPKKGDLVKHTEKKYEYEGLNPYSITRFDEAHNITESIQGVGEEQITIKVAGGAMPIMSFYNTDKELTMKIVVHGARRPTQLDLFDPKGAPMGKCVVTYVAPQKIDQVQEMYIKDQGLIKKTTFTHDEQDRLTQVITQEPALKKNAYLRQQTETIQYDQHNHPNRVLIQNKNNSFSITFSYQLDQQNNWTKAIEYSNGVPIYIVERVITYH